jgi:non-ribosomal peptide synthase protein (TIGR01720 family)
VLVETLAAAGVTRLQVVPSLVPWLLEVPGFAACQTLRTLCCGGEALSAALVTRVLTLRPDLEVYNLYGPTEATIDATWARAERDWPRATVPIGRPIANLHAYVLDAAGRPAAVGVPGEIHLGGVGLARGYVRQPGLTAARFVPDAISGAAGARLYRTGDRGRWTPAGLLEYLGRADQQIKVRGVRVEVGEIEAALTRDPHVRAAAVSLRPEAAGARLVAHLVAAEGPPPSLAAVRARLAAAVPDAMVPHLFVWCDRLPQLPNGKLDRRALASLPLEPSAAVPAPAVLQTDAQRLLTDLWCDILGLERVGLHDNFFELGGDSILSIQIVAKAAERGLKLTVRQMFQYQTIDELAQVATAIGARQLEAPESIAGGAFPLSPIQERYFELDHPNIHHFNQSVVLDAEGLTFAAVDALTTRLVAHHDALRLRFSHTAHGWTQQYAAHETHRLAARIDLSAVAPGRVQEEFRRCAQTLHASLNVTAGPIVRVGFFTLGDAGSRLVFIVHHLAMDGVSWRILLDDFQRGLAQHRRGAAIAFADKTTSYRQWVDDLVAHAASPAVRDQATYWLDEGRLDVATLPLDLPGDNTLASVDGVLATLDADGTGRLLHELPKTHRVRAHETLLAAVASALAEWTGHRRQYIDIEGHGREEGVGGGDLSRTVGWFTSLYPLPIELPLEDDPGAIVAAVKQQLRAVPNNGIGYGGLRTFGSEEVRARLRALAPPAVSFNYMGQVDQTSLAGFTLASESAGRKHGPGGRRSHVLQITAVIVHGELTLQVLFSTSQFRRETIQALIDRMRDRLVRFVQHCARTSARLIAADVPLSALTEAQVAALVARYPDAEDIYPLAPVQHGMLFHYLYEPRSGFYVGQTILRARALDGEAFRDAWRQVIRRHAILRTAFVTEDLPSPMQLVRGNAEPEWIEMDWRGLHPREQEASLRTWLLADRARGFDFSEAPLMRFALMRLGQDECQVVWTLHHVLLDGWSIPRLIDDVLRLYQARRDGHSIDLPEVVPYRHFIAWLQSRDESRAEAFWRRVLTGYRRPLALEFDDMLDDPLAVPPLGARHDGAGPDEMDDGVYEERLDETASWLLQSFAQREQVTLATMVQATWALLLARYTHSGTIVFGITVSGRPPELPGVDSMVGPFINVVPLRLDIDAHLTVIGFLRRVQLAAADVRQFEQTPLPKIQGWSELPKGVPLFESIVTFQNYPSTLTAAAEAATAQLSVSRIEALERAHYPLALRAAPGSRFILRIGFDPARVPRGMARQILSHYRTVLMSLVEMPTGRLSEIDILSDAERQRIAAWSEAASADSPR